MSTQPPRDDAVPADDVPTRAGAEPTPVHLPQETGPSIADVNTRDEFATAAHTPPGPDALAETDWQTTAPQSAATRAHENLPPLDPAANLQRLGHYALIKQLGSGGMGAVYEAEDTHLRRRVALKIMLPSWAASPGARKRFLHEARAAAAVEHDHIVPIYQVSSDEGTPFIAMQLLKGESLHERIKRQPQFTLAEILRIGREIAEGLAAAHQRNLIHRDIKPGNLWLEPGGRLKILDFGLARAVEATASDPAVPAAAPEPVRSQLPQLGAVVGTPGYLAPEQVGGQAVDARSDLFSLGCVLYQLCTGKLPYPARDAVTALTALATEQPKPPREWNPAIPPALSLLVMQLLAKKPADRPASARDVSQRIARLEAQANQRRWLRRISAAGTVSVLACSIVLFAARDQLFPRAANVVDNGNVPLPPIKEGEDPILASIAGELRRIPAAVPTLMREDRLADLSSFKGKSFDKYRADYESWTELEKRVNAEPAKHPLRAAVLTALKTLKETDDVRIKEGYLLIGPMVANETKAFVMKAQTEPAKFTFQLEQTLEEYLQAGDAIRNDPTNEPSERWRAHYDYVRAVLVRRLIFMSEYNYALGRIRADNLPELQAKSIGWKLVRVEKAQAGESKRKGQIKELARLWNKILQDHPDTPWALLAQRERQSGLGLEWRPDPE